MSTKKPKSTSSASSNGLQFGRYFTSDTVNVYDMFDYDYRTSVIRNPSGEVVFEMTNVEVPKKWCFIFCDII
jgi:ribonucleoside-diphosphate reductase alpha chain